MLVWLRALVFVLFIMTVIYVVLWIKAQLKVRARAKAEYINMKTDMTRDEYVDSEIAEYNRSYRPKLLLAIYILPLTLMGLLLYLVNH